MFADPALRVAEMYWFITELEVESNTKLYSLHTDYGRTLKLKKSQISANGYHSFLKQNARAQFVLSALLAGSSDREAVGVTVVVPVVFSLECPRTIRQHRF